MKSKSMWCPRCKGDTSHRVVACKKRCSPCGLVSNNHQIETDSHGDRACIVCRRLEL